LAGIDDHLEREYITKMLRATNIHLVVGMRSSTTKRIHRQELHRRDSPARCLARLHQEGYVALDSLAVQRGCAHGHLRAVQPLVSWTFDRKLPLCSVKVKAETLIFD
jgi:hypothetical protein